MKTKIHPKTKRSGLWLLMAGIAVIGLMMIALMAIPILFSTWFDDNVRNDPRRNPPPKLRPHELTPEQERRLREDNWLDGELDAMPAPRCPREDTSGIDFTLIPDTDTP